MNFPGGEDLRYAKIRIDCCEWRDREIWQLTLVWQTFWFSSCGENEASQYWFVEVLSHLIGGNLR